MRAVFTVDIPLIDGKYPDNEYFLERLRANGWEDMSFLSLKPEEKLERYKAHASQLFSEMPELAAEEKDYVIFFGVLQDTQTKFIVTRRILGQATFRLLHPVLGKLQPSTEKMVRQLISPIHHDKPLPVSYQSIVIYERGFDDVIIKGRVIPAPFREAWRVNKKDAFLIIGSFLLLVPTIIAQLYVDTNQHRVIGGNLERLSTVLVTTMIVSLLGFLQTYVDIRKKKIIAWTVGFENQDIE